jgi:hypothetical protein
MPLIYTYTLFGGEHPETAALANVLAASGLRAPHTDAPFSEALLFGIGGGPGAGYILWEFQEHGMKVLVQGFHHLWQYPMRYYQALCDRLGVAISMPETGSLKAADRMLQDALDQGKPAVAWVDRAHLPYLQLPEALKGHIGHILAICGQEEGEILVDDRASQPFRVPADVMANARSRISSYKNRLLLVEHIGACDLRAAVLSGLQACAEHLSSDSDSFSLPTYRKWAKMMTDAKNKKGWPTLFRDRRGLYATLRSAFEGIELDVGAGALRGLYAQFLDEAAALLADDRLGVVAGQYRALTQRWHALAEAALPDDVPALAETKALLRQRHAATRLGGDAWQSSRPITETLRTMSARYNLDFPMQDPAVQTLFAALQEHLYGLYEAEKSAHQALKDAIA